MNLKKPEISTGRGRELTEALQEWLLLFEKVKNKVVFVNKEVYLPLKLEEGKETPLGLFVKSALPERFDEKTGEKRLEVWPEHRRSAFLGRVIFGDKQGRLYRDIDLKGIGSITKEKKILKPQTYYYPFSGLLENKFAFFDYKKSEEFLSKGIRTARTLSIIELEEIIVEGEKISLEEARKKGIILPEFQPVIEVRGFGSKARIADIISP